MSSNGRRFRRGVRLLGIGLLISSVIRVPLPQADYHNVRHHDAPGEICRYHDHLLRWHPSADSNQDVTLLHWHWFVPLVELASHHGGPGDAHRGAPSGPALHAYLEDLPTPDWQGKPVIIRDSRGRFVDRLALGLPPVNSASLLHQTIPAGLRHGLFCPWDLDAWDTVRAERNVLFQRWNC